MPACIRCNLQKQTEASLHKKIQLWPLDFWLCQSGLQLLCVQAAALINSVMVEEDAMFRYTQKTKSLERNFLYPRWCLTGKLSFQIHLLCNCIMTDANSNHSSHPNLHI